MSHPPQILVSCPVPRPMGMDGTVPWTVPLVWLWYTPNPSVLSHPTVPWDGRDCPGDSHLSHPTYVALVYPNPGVLSRPAVPRILTCPTLALVYPQSRCALQCFKLFKRGQSKVSGGGMSSLALHNSSGHLSRGGGGSKDSRGGKCPLPPLNEFLPSRLDPHENPTNTVNWSWAVSSTCSSHCPQFPTCLCRLKPSCNC